MKAYYFANCEDFDIIDINEKITFAESPGKAKQNFSILTNIHYKYIRVQRMKWADYYGVVKDIPVQELLEHGWYFICNICGKRIEQLQDLNSTSHGYMCNKCFYDVKERNF